MTQIHFRVCHADIDVSGAETEWHDGCGISQKDWFYLWQYFEAAYVEPKKKDQLKNRSTRERTYAFCKFCPGTPNTPRTFWDLKVHAETHHPELVNQPTDASHGTATAAKKAAVAARKAARAGEGGGDSGEEGGAGSEEAGADSGLATNPQDGPNFVDLT